MLTFDPVLHKYYVDGSEKPGVSKIIEIAGLSTPFVKPKHNTYCPKELDDDEECTCGAETAPRYGTAVHEMIRLFELGTLDLEALDPGLMNAFRAYSRFRYEHSDYEPIEDADGPLIERPMYSERYGYAGTPDLPMRHKRTKRGVIFDTKTSVSMTDSMELQLSGYDQLVREHLGIEKLVPFDRKILWLKWDLEVPIIKEMTDPAARHTFLAATTIFRWRERHEKL